MAFVTGLFLIDAPAAALNNLGNLPGSRTDNTVGVKIIRAKEGGYPYVSAQAFRYWLRATLEKGHREWRAAPVYREEKIAYTDANPIRYWDDDLFGYMRAPSTKSSAKALRESDTRRAGETPTNDTITRVSPFRVSTVVSLGPVPITSDFGTMTRQEGDPVPHEHQFYRTTLRGLFSLDLHACGTFSYRQRTGYRNLDDGRVELAKSDGLEHLASEKSYRLPLAERITRVQALFEGFAHLEGGAKQSIHYTDVAPVLTLLAVTKGGNHIFGHVITTDANYHPVVNIPALREALTVFKDDLLSDVYLGWSRGYLDEQRATIERELTNGGALAGLTPIHILHPREAFLTLADQMTKAEQATWLA